MKSKIFLNGVSVVGGTRNEKRPLVTKRALAIAVASTAITGAPAFADGGTDLGNLASGWNSQFSSVGKTALNACSVLGIVIAGGGLLELKRSQDPNNQGRDSPKSAGTKIAAGGGLAAVTQIMNVGIGTIFSGGAGNSSVSQGTVNFNGGS